MAAGVERKGYLYHLNVDRMMVLGVMLTTEGTTSDSVKHNLQAAEANYWKHVRILRRLGSLRSWLQAWNDAPATRAVFASGTWHVTEACLQRICRREYQWLRTNLRMRSKLDEGWMQLKVRTRRRIDTWTEGLGIKRLHHRVFFALHWTAWREKHIKLDGGGKNLVWLREDRCATWWAVVNSVGQRARQREGLQ